MIKPNETDLGEAEAPEDVPRILRNAAQAYRESQSELQAAWQDRGAGHPWPIIAKHLEKIAERIEKSIP